MPEAAVLPLKGKLPPPTNEVKRPERLSQKARESDIGTAARYAVLREASTVPDSRVDLDVREQALVGIRRLQSLTSGDFSDSPIRFKTPTEDPSARPVIVRYNDGNWNVRNILKAEDDTFHCTLESADHSGQLPITTTLTREQVVDGTIAAEWPGIKEGFSAPEQQVIEANIAVSKGEKPKLSDDEVDQAIQEVAKDSGLPTLDDAEGYVNIVFSGKEIPDEIQQIFQEGKLLTAESLATLIGAGGVDSNLFTASANAAQENGQKIELLLKQKGLDNKERENLKTQLDQSLAEVTIYDELAANFTSADVVKVTKGYMKKVLNGEVSPEQAKQVAKYFREANIESIVEEAHIDELVSTKTQEATANRHHQEKVALTKKILLGSGVGVGVLMMLIVSQSRQEHAQAA